MAGRLSSWRALRKWQENHPQSLEKNSRKPIKNTRNTDIPLDQTRGMKAGFSSLRPANVSPGLRSTKTQQNSFLKKSNRDDCTDVARQSANLKSKSISGIYRRPRHPRLPICGGQSQRPRPGKGRG